MYWTTLWEGAIRTANLDGTNETVLISGLNSPSGISVDEVNGKIYWTEWSGSNNVRRANLDGTGIENLVTNMPNANVITLDVANNYMYWSDWDDNTVLRANLDGSNITTLISGAKMKVEAMMAETELTTEEILNLKVDDVIVFNKNATSSSNKIYINKKEKFLTLSGLSNNRKAIQIQANLDKEKQETLEILRVMREERLTKSKESSSNIKRLLEERKK